MNDWRIERAISSESNDLCKDGFVHSGFHGKEGRQYALERKKHFLGLVGQGEKLGWTVANDMVFEDLRARWLRQEHSTS